MSIFSAKPKERSLETVSILFAQPLLLFIKNDYQPYKLHSLSRLYVYISYTLVSMTYNIYENH